MNQYEYIEDKISLNQPHIPVSKIMQMRASAGWVCILTERKGDLAILKFKRKIQ